MRASAGLWALGVLGAALWGTSSQAQEGLFQEVAPGVELATLQAPQRSPTGDSRRTVVRVEVAKRPLRFYGVGALGLSEGLTADQWSLRYGLLAVINAGMFETDYRTPTGYAKVADRELNPRWKGKYQSLLVMDPKDPSLPCCSSTRARRTRCMTSTRCC